MRVVLLGPYPPPHGGVQTNLAAIRGALLERGMGCQVINLTRFRQEDKDGIYYPQTTWGVLSLLLRLEYDVIHLHVGGDLRLRHAGLLWLCSLIPGKRVVFTFHSGGYPSSPAGQRAAARSFRGFALRSVDCVIAVNQELVDLFRRFGVAPDRIRLIAPHACVDEASIAKQLPSTIADFFAAHHPAIVTVSGLEPEYDLPLQIEAVGHLRRLYPSLGLAIVGGGSIEKEIRERIDNSPDRGHLLMCGDVDHQIALAAVRRASLFWRTTWYDGDAISVREALQLGVPAIATDNGMRPAGVNLIAKGDLEGLCRVSKDLLANCPAQASTACATSGDENLKAILKLYSELTREPGVPKRAKPARDSQPVR